MKPRTTFHLPDLDNFRIELSKGKRVVIQGVGTFEKKAVKPRTVTGFDGKEHTTKKNRVSFKKSVTLDHICNK